MAKTVKQSYSTIRTENMKALFAVIKSRNHWTDTDIAKMLNMPLSTFTARKANPANFRMGEMWMLMQLASVQEEVKPDLL